jgi:hypothetical protein
VVAAALDALRPQEVGERVDRLGARGSLLLVSEAVVECRDAEREDQQRPVDHR